MGAELAQAIVNGILTGALIAVPAIGFTTIYAVLRFPDFAVAAYATIGAYAGWWVNVRLGLGVGPVLVAAFVGAGVLGVGGVLLGFDTSIDPLTGYRVVLSVFAAAVLGGLGSVPGVVAGALLLGGPRRWRCWGCRRRIGRRSGSPRSC